MAAGDDENSTLAFLKEGSTLSPEAELRERIKVEFYQTYDVMTGIRIAATLGGFFSMMILLVLYKNYCKPSKTLSEEQLNAAVTAAAEEEDRALQAALEATSFYTSLGQRRQSLEQRSQVLLSPRFSSVGGGYSHLTPPLKIPVLQQRGKSLPGSVMQFGLNGSPSLFKKNIKGQPANETDFNFDAPTADFFPYKNQLNVPLSRRVSSVTCSSADSSYLERRCSAFEMGLPGPPHFVRQSREKLLGKKEEPWDFYYPIDIQVIQPTPEMSPTASERNLHEDQTHCSLQVPRVHDQMHRLSVTSFEMGLAPLASISSLGSFNVQTSSLTSKNLNSTVNSYVESQVCTCADDSVGSDSVFMDDLDMDDDVEELATDSEFEYDGFDDDYSFCESQPRPVSRTEMRTLKFASFDSYDAAITQDSVCENADEENSRVETQTEEKSSSQTFHREPIAELKRHPSLHDGNKVRKKLIKTYSEPRNGKTLKHLPPWVEKSRSGYIPKRQLSSPSARKKKVVEISTENQKLEKVLKNEEDIQDEKNCEPSQEEKNAKDFEKFYHFSSLSSCPSDTVTITSIQQKSDEESTSTSKQGINKDMPFKSSHHMSLPNTQGKRSRLQKQKNFVEDIKSTNLTVEKTKVQVLPGSGESDDFVRPLKEFLKPSEFAETSPAEKQQNTDVTPGDTDESSGIHQEISFITVSSQSPASK